MIVMTRAGIDLLWTPAEDAPARLSLVEVAPIGLLLAVCLALMLGAGPVMAYLEAASAALHDPAGYVSAVGNAAAGAPPSSALFLSRCSRWRRSRGGYFFQRF